MPQRLTDSLVQKGIISPEAADQAMDRLVLMGGALDTCLLELQLLDEATLTSALAHAYDMEAASTEVLDRPADERAVRAFPEQWAKKHILAPLELTDDSLSVLSPAPADFDALRRLGELLELEILPVLAPEFRVRQRLHRLYGTRPAERFQALLDRFGDEPPEHAEPGVRDEVEPPTQPDLLPTPPTDPKAGAPRDFLPFEPPPLTPPQEALQPELRFADAVKAVNEAVSADDVVHTAVRYAGQWLPFVALLKLDDGVVRGWAGAGAQAELVPQVYFELEAESAFQVVATTRNHYLGPLPSDPVQSQFLAQLGRAAPASTLILPIRAQQRTVGLLYADNGARTVSARLAADLMLFLTHAQVALETLSPNETRSSAEPTASPVSNESDRPIALIDSAPPSDADALETPFDPAPPAAVPPEPSGPSTWIPTAADDDIVEFSVLPGEPTTEPSNTIPPPEAPLASIDEGEFDAQAYPTAVVAENADGSDLAEALSKPTTGEAELAPMPPEDDDSGGWEPVEADNWDEAIPPDGGVFAGPVNVQTAPGLLGPPPPAVSPRPPEAVKPSRPPPRLPPPLPSPRSPPADVLRRSLIEDATVPDLSPEAWIRASSEVTRPKPLSADVVHRSELPYPEVADADPVPLTNVAVSRLTIPVAELDGTAPSDPEISGLLDLAPEDVQRLEDVVAQILVDDDRPSNDADVAELIDQLGALDPDVRNAACDVLAERGVSVLPMVMDHFPGVLDVDPFVPDVQLPAFARCGATLALIERAGAESHPYVSPLLDAQDPLHRFFAIYFYAAVYVPEAMPRLIQRLHDEEPRICMLAARTLFSYRDHPNFPLVLEHLHGRLSANSLAARRHAAYLIGLFRDVTAIPQLIQLIARRERAMLDVVEDALAEITKQRLGTSAKRWRAWWAKNQSRSRINWLLDGLAAKDADLRQSAAVELNAVTGMDLGFDGHAPRRQREEARQRWLKWWKAQQAKRAVHLA